VDEVEKTAVMKAEFLEPRQSSMDKSGNVWGVATVPGRHDMVLARGLRRMGRRS